MAFSDLFTDATALRKPMAEARAWWTDERIAQLEELWKAGWSARQIKMKMGCVSRSAVIGKVHRLGLAPRGARTPLLDNRHRSKRVRTPKHLRNKPTAFQAFVAALPVEPAPPPAQDIARVAFGDLEAHHCRWVIGEPSRGQCCGCDKVPGLPYCADHARRAYRLPEPFLKASIGHNVRRRINGHLREFGFA